MDEIDKNTKAFLSLLDQVGILPYSQHTGFFPKDTFYNVAEDFADYFSALTSVKSFDFNDDHQTGGRENEERIMEKQKLCCYLGF